MSKNRRPRMDDEEYALWMGIKESCKEHKIAPKDVDHGWAKSKTSSVHFRNPAYKSPEEIQKEVDFDSIVSKYIDKAPLKVSATADSSFFDRLVYTDVHIGMDTNKNGFSLYGGKWDEEEVLGRLDSMIAHVIKNQKSRVLLIDELGDFMDGWDGETVRKGHHLPQNLTNEQAFDLGVRFKVQMIDTLLEYYDKIICHNICNDNHAGSFGYIVNSAFKSIIDMKYNNVEVVNIRKFIDHYFYGNNCFVLTHGKDGKNLKFGFKPKLDPKQIEVIKNYIDEHFLHQKGVNIEFCKGDSHQKIYDESSSDAFDYYNFLAFSPSSEWVQTNYKKGKSGFEFFNYNEDGTKSLHPYVFEWKTNRIEETIDFSRL